ncbi:NAD(P)/FAD-dependent oxidoreductase [Arenibaculum sp.]|uniref:NAD(P)/FAD-dependent oxidoreductase n=1 Tax=Arenibaculum sp. TaxID=2865862 RepID=UPI002E10D0D7|nr:NAD(P)/FAD-dependent oxidoreductase [Arenibaculum sp.]
MYDCLVVGGGPAGLTAAVYLGRYRRKVVVVDAHESRAAWIPLSHNMAGFPEGITGIDLLTRMRVHAERYGAEFTTGTVEVLERTGRGFAASLGGGGRLEAATVILATGVVDLEPELPDLYQAVQRGLIRHCPVCDAYEVVGDRIAVIGHGADALGEALFLRTYSDDVTMLTLGRPMELTPEERRLMAEAGISALEAAVAKVAVREGRIAAVELADGKTHAFDTLYSALSTMARNGPAASLAAAMAADGRLVVDEHQRTSVPGVFAAGDIVDGLNQIAVATGQAAIAATTIHNDLRNGRLPAPVDPA